MQAAVKAKEVYGVASSWVETNVGPHVVVVTDKAKEYGSADVEQLGKEGVLSQDQMKEAYAVASSQLAKTSGPFVLNSVIGDVPFVDKIPNVEIVPADKTNAFIFWNLVCLALGYFDVTLFAIGHFAGDATRDVATYFPMYVLKLGADVMVCTFLAYAIYFLMVKSAATKAQQVAMGFLGFVALKGFATVRFFPASPASASPPPPRAPSAALVRVHTHTSTLGAAG